MPSSVRGQLYGTVNLQCELLSVVQVRSPFFSDAKARFPVCRCRLSPLSLPVWGCDYVACNVVNDKIGALSFNSGHDLSYFGHARRPQALPRSIANSQYATHIPIRFTLTHHDIG